MEDFLKKKIDDLIGSGENKKPLIIVVHPTNNPKHEISYLLEKIPIELRCLYKTRSISRYSKSKNIGEGTQLIFYRSFGDFYKNDLDKVLEIQSKTSLPIVCVAPNSYIETCEIDTSLFELYHLKVAVKTDLNIVQITSDFVSNKQQSKPLMCIFCGDNGQTNMAVDGYKNYLRDKYKYCTVEGNPFEGHRCFFDKNGETKRVADHPELLQQVFLPNGFDNSTQIIIYHLYVDQFNPKKLNYLVKLKEIVGNTPIICIMNEYCYKDDVDLTAFDVRRLQVSISISEI